MKILFQLIVLLSSLFLSFISYGQQLDVEGSINALVSSGEHIAIRGTSLTPPSLTGGFVNVGVLGAASAGRVQSFGVYGTATGSSAVQFGVHGRVASHDSVTLAGVIGIAEGIGLGNQFGIAGAIFEESDGTRYAVFGQDGATGGTHYAGYFAGDVEVTGILCAPSDKNLKKKISSINNQLSKITQLNPVQFQMRTEEFPSMGLPPGQQLGFIAQEVAQLYPELVSDATYTDPTFRKDDLQSGKKKQIINYKNLNVLGLIPILTKGIQELKAENELLKREIALLLQRQLDLEGELSKIRLGANHNK